MLGLRFGITLGDVPSGASWAEMEIRNPCLHSSTQLSLEGI